MKTPIALSLALSVLASGCASQSETAALRAQINDVEKGVLEAKSTIQETRRHTQSAQEQLDAMDISMRNIENMLNEDSAEPEKAVRKAK